MGRKSGTNKIKNTLDRRVMPAFSYSGKRTAIKSITKTQGKTGSLISQLIRCLSFLFLTSKRISSAVHRKSMLFLMWIGNCICAKVLNAGSRLYNVFTAISGKEFAVYSFLLNCLIFNILIIIIIIET